MENLLRNDKVIQTCLMLHRAEQQKVFTVPQQGKRSFHSHSRWFWSLHPFLSIRPWRQLQMSLCQQPEETQHDNIILGGGGNKSILISSITIWLAAALPRTRADCSVSFALLRRWLAAIYHPSRTLRSAGKITFLFSWCLLLCTNITRAARWCSG